MNDMNFAVPFGKSQKPPTRRMLPHLIARVMGNKYAPDGVPARVRKAERKGAEMIVKEMKDGH